MWILPFIPIAFPCSDDAEALVEYIPLQEGISSNEICGEHSNFYTFELLQHHILFLDVLFSHVQGDIDVYLYNADTMELLRSSTSSSDNELITYRAFQDSSLLVEIQTHPSVLFSSEEIIPYVLQTNFVLGTCEDNFDLWRLAQENTQEQSPSEGEDNENDPLETVESSTGYPFWNYSRNEAVAFSFSSDEPSDNEIFFEEQICLFSEHWYHLEGHIGEEIDVQLVYPKTISTNVNTEDTSGNSIDEQVVFSSPVMKMYLYDSDGQLLRIANMEEVGDNYRGIVSYDFLSYSDVSNVYVQIVIDDVESDLDYEGFSIPYELLMTRHFFDICLDDNFEGNWMLDQAVSISTGSYTLQACYDDFFQVYLEGNYDIRLEYELIDGELDLILYDEIFDEISRSSSNSGEDILSIHADGDVYIHISLREDRDSEGVPYVLSIYPTSLEDGNGILEEDEDRIYMDTGDVNSNGNHDRKSGCTTIERNQSFGIVFWSFLWISFRRSIKYLTKNT